MTPDPKYATNVPKKVVLQPRLGNDILASLSFGPVRVPKSGILTQQDCCEADWETRLCGRFLATFERANHNF